MDFVNKQRKETVQLKTKTIIMLLIVFPMYVLAQFDYGYESFSPFVLKVDDERYATRLLFDVIVNRMMMDRDPVDLILYSGKTEEKMYKQNMRDFMKKLETDYVAMFKVVAKVKELGDLPVPDYRPWNAKGCIPQVKGQSYSVDGPKLVPLNKIVK